MLNLVLFLRALGEGGATREGVVKEGLSTASCPHSRGVKDAAS